MNVIERPIGKTFVPGTGDTVVNQPHQTSYFMDLNILVGSLFK